MNYVLNKIKEMRYGYSFLMRRMVHLNLQLLYRCNFTCRICDFWKEPFTDLPMLSLEQTRVIVEKLKPLGPQIISIGGGEPLMHPELIEIIQCLAKDNFPVMICNGWFVTPEKARELFQAGLHEVSISVDYASAEKHDKQRGMPGAFDRAVNALKVLNENRTSSSQRVHMISVVMDDNLEEVEALIQLSKEIGITYLVTLYSSGRGHHVPGGAHETESKESLLTRDDVAAHLLELRAKYPEFVSLPGFLERFSEPVSPCYAGRNLFNIDSRGNVSRCIDTLDEPAGNIFDDDMPAIQATLKEQQGRGDCDACWTSCRGSIETLMYGDKRLYNLFKSYDVTKGAPLIPDGNA
ncbi:MAG: radical SAM protein [bacterium]|nr:radical SAM protein [bacterium]